MGLLPGFKNDIFISYNHADDLRGEVPHGMNGWVGSFAVKLKAGLEGLLKKEMADARTGSIEVFWDYDLEKDQVLTDTLKDHVENSAIFIVIMSDHYLNSDWCGQESQWFQTVASRRRLALAGASGADNFHPLILTHIGQTDRTLWPAHLANSDLLGYDFYHKDITTGGAHKLGTRFCYPTIDVSVPKEQGPFYDELSRLKMTLYRRFKQALAASAPRTMVSGSTALVRPTDGVLSRPAAGRPAAGTNTSPPSVKDLRQPLHAKQGVLLVASQDGGIAHSDVEAALLKAGVDIVPSTAAARGVDWDDATHRASSLLLVLGKPNGERDLQLTEALDAATRQAIDVHAWIPLEISLAKIEALDPDLCGPYKALFDRVKPLLWQCPVADLVTRISAASQRDVQSKASSARIRVYVDADRVDRDIVDELVKTLRDGDMVKQLAAHRIHYKVESPLFDASTCANNEIYERIKENNGVIVVYGRIDTSILERKIDRIERKSIEREAESGQEIRVMIHDGPKPDDRASPCMIYSGMMHIDARRRETYRDEIVKCFIDIAEHARTQRAVM
jgi:hypothetical protein